MWDRKTAAGSAVRAAVDTKPAKAKTSLALDARGYDRGSEDICREVIASSGLVMIRVQLFPEQ